MATAYANVEAFVRGAAGEVYGGTAKVVDLESPPTIYDQRQWKPLHSGQLRAWSSIARYVAIFAGWRSGKTEIGPWWLLREMQRQGAGDYAIIAPTFPLLNGKARPAMRKAIVRALGADGYTSSGDEWFITEAGQMKLWGEARGETRILFRHGTRAEAVEAFDAKGIWCDEPGQLEDELWEQIQARVSIGLYRILFTSRPYKFNWYVQEIWRRCMEVLRDGTVRRKRDADPEIDVINFSSIDNPAFSQEEFDKQRERLPWWRFALKFLGIPTRPAGVVYDCFDEANIVDSFPRPDLGKDERGEVIRATTVPAEWPLWGGADYGLVNAATVLLAEELEWDWFKQCYKDNPTGNYYLVSAYHAGDGDNPEQGPATARDHVRRTRAQAAFVVDGEPSKPRMIGGAHGEQDSRDLWGTCGMPVAEPPITAVNVQIECVYAGFKTRKLKVARWLTKMIAEIEEFSYKIDPETGEVTEDFDDEAKYHRLAALRYVGCKLFKRADVPPGSDSPPVRY